MSAAVRPRARMLVPALVVALVGTLLVGFGVPAIAQAPAAVAAGTPLPAAVPAARPVVATEQAAITAAMAAARSRSATTLRLEKVAAHAQFVRVQQMRTDLVKVARKQIGDRYSAGSSGPNAFDCSGLTRYVYKVVTGKELPHYSGAQYASAKKISRSKARPGDLVFFMRGGAHHVGLYIGNGKMIDAPGYGEPVRVSPISGSWWSRTYSGIGRILPA